MMWRRRERRARVGRMEAGSREAGAVMKRNEDGWLTD